MLLVYMTMTAFKTTGLWIVKRFLAPEHKNSDNSKISEVAELLSTKRKLAGNLRQPSATSEFCFFSFFFFVDKSINRESPKRCHFQLLNQYPTTFFDQEVEYTYIILYS